MKIKIAAILGIVSMISSVFLAIKNTKDEMKANENEGVGDTDESSDEEKSTVKKIIRTVRKKVKAYWPTMLSTAFAIFCFCFALHVSVKQTAAAVAACKMAKEGYVRYKDAAKDVYGKSKESFVESKACETAMNASPLNPSTAIYETGNGDTLFYDIILKKYFRSSITYIKTVLYDIQTMLDDSEGPWFYSYKSLMSRIGLKELLKDCDFDPDGLGWNSSDGEIYIGFNPQVIGEDERCIVLSYTIMPCYNYEM